MRTCVRYVKPLLTLVLLTYAREVQEPFYLSLSKWKLSVLKWLQSKITFDPHEVLSKLEDHR